jgi:hypothetical protein
MSIDKTILRPTNCTAQVGAKTIIMRMIMSLMLPQRPVAVRRLQRTC